MANLSNEELLEQFDNTITELTKAVNGWSRRSESKLCKEADKLKAEILRRMSH